MNLPCPDQGLAWCAAMVAMWAFQAPYGSDRVIDAERMSQIW